MGSKMIKILAIDDNEDNLVSLKALIKDGFPDAMTFTALNGTKGIELAAKEDPDVILLDIVMSGMDGYEVCQKLKAEDLMRDIPIVFVTAIKLDKESRIRALECGAEGFLSKPIDESELIAQIRAMVKIRNSNMDKLYEKERLRVLVEKQTQELKLAYNETLKLLDEVKKENHERKKTEKALKMSEERFKLLFDKAPLGYQSLDIDGNFIDINEQWLYTLGYTRDEVIGKWFGDFLSTDFKEGFRKRFPIFKAQGHIHSEFEMVHKNGKELFIAFEGRVGYETNGEFKQTHCILQDITERKRSEEKLKKSEERLIMILNATPFPVALVDTKDNIIEDWSHSAITLFGHTAPTTDEWYKLAYPDDDYRREVIERWKPALEKARLSTQPVNAGEYQVTCSNGSVLICELYATFIEDKLIVTFNNITERKQYEEDLIKAKEKAQESDRLKSAFLSNMSHEIRTPMNGIIGFTELLKEPSLSTDDQQDFIKTIQISGERMLNTINNIIDISKIESGLINVVIDETNINKKIEFIYKFFKPEVEKKGLQLIFINGIPTNDAVIRTDNEKVYGILTNLIKNAIKFTYEGSIEFGYEKKGEYLEFFVKDTGIGIPQKQQQTIFERFIQGSSGFERLYEGSGLGLSIAKSYVEMLGGKIWLESEEGKGSSFYFTIPYHSVEGGNTGIKNIDPEELKEVQMKNLKILIVEDDEVSYSLLKRTIQKISKEVLHAITGVEAIEACRSNPDLALVLMDIRMPIMDGCEATRQIRKFNKDVIIIAQTAYAFSGDSEKAFEAGCSDFITKPINMTALFGLIKKLVNK